MEEFSGRQFEANVAGTSTLCANVRNNLYRGQYTTTRTSTKTPLPGFVLKLASPYVGQAHNFALEAQRTDPGLPLVQVSGEVVQLDVPRRKLRVSALPGTQEIESPGRPFAAPSHGRCNT